MKIAFFGTPKLAASVLEELINSKFKPNFVVTAPDAKFGRGQKLAESAVKQVAKKNEIKVYQPKDLNNWKLEIEELDFDIAVLVAYGKIIPKNVLEIPKYGFVNLHPSLLPEFRGPSPIQGALLAGAKKTGVSIMLLDEEIDHGPILAQNEIEIKNTDNHMSLSQKLSKAGTKLLIDTLEKYVKEDLKPKPQNHSKATYTDHIEKQNGLLNINNLPPKEKIQRMIKAYYPWPGVWTKAEGKIIKFFPNQKVQIEGKKPMTVKDFLNGFPKYKELIEKII